MQTSILRGIRCACPACGRGRLYRTYLKPFDKCASCHASIGDIRADDGPSWLTILLLGPFLVLLTLGISRAHYSPWISYPLLGALILILVIGALPRVKGGFIGALWYLQKQ